MLQEAVGAAIDGEIGPLTRVAALRQPVARTLALYADIRRRRYRALPHFWRFGKGWLRRVDAALALAIDIDRTMPSAPVPAASDPQPKEPTPMETTKPSPEQPAAAEPKWWGQSMTLWGVLLTTLSTVLPTIGPLFGVNITADLVTQLGEQIVLAGQAIAALVGTLMTVYGRIRASAPLERRQITMNM
jgi:lysozyme family protein